MKKHTPGPWRLERGAAGRLTVRGHHGERVEVLSTNIRDEDAALIAAAPVLADALEVLLGDPPWVDDADAREWARAALRIAGRLQ